MSFWTLQTLKTRKKMEMNEDYVVNIYLLDYQNQEKEEKQCAVDYLRLFLI